jgi:signal peptidase
MPSKSDNVWALWLRRIAGAVLALVALVLAWSHGMLYVEGGSMRPALYPGDLIVYTRVAVEPQQGDLTVFAHDGDLVVHRVVGVEPDGSLRMRGDANAAADVEPVDRNDVRGVVVAVVPAGRVACSLVSAAE